MGNHVVQIKAFHLKRSIDIRNIKAIINRQLVSESNSELFYAYDGCYLFIIQYGAIVFYNYTPEQIKPLMSRILGHHNLKEEDLLVDEFDLMENQDTYIGIEFEHLTVRKADADAVKVILLNMAQSIALSYYDSVSQELITEVRQFTTMMEQKGRLDISTRDILKFIGKTLNTQNRIAENLYIFDAPAITWENEYYNAINTTLSKHFELNNRYRSIENNLKIIEANLHAFMEVNNHRESSKLEWIIIILILVELIDTFMGKLWPFI